MLTPEQKMEYLARNGTRCPYCGSDSLEGRDIAPEGMEYAQVVACLDCDKTWRDIYTLNDIEER